MKERRTARKPRSLAGQLLLAHPVLREPTFRRTVILLSAHSDEGAMGVVLNRPLDRQLAELNALRCVDSLMHHFLDGSSILPTSTRLVSQ